MLVSNFAKMGTAVWYVMDSKYLPTFPLQKLVEIFYYRSHWWKAEIQFWKVFACSGHIYIHPSIFLTADTTISVWCDVLTVYLLYEKRQTKQHFKKTVLWKTFFHSNFNHHKTQNQEWVIFFCEFSDQITP